MRGEVFFCLITSLSWKVVILQLFHRHYQNIALVLSESVVETWLLIMCCSRPQRSVALFLVYYAALLLAFTSKSGVLWRTSSLQSFSVAFINFAASTALFFFFLEGGSLLSHGFEEMFWFEHLSRGEITTNIRFIGSDPVSRRAESFQTLC